MTLIDPSFARAVAWGLATGPQELIGVINASLLQRGDIRTVTWLATAPDHSVTHRIGTSDPQGFPIGGWDPIDDSAWNRRIFGEKQPVVGDTPDAMRAFIPETDQLVAMGYGATLCAPIVIGGAVRGVLCVLGDSGILTPVLLAEIDTLLPIAALVFAFPKVAER